MRRIDRAQKALAELVPKLNAYHLKTQKQIQTSVDEICKDVSEYLDVKITTYSGPQKWDSVLR